MEGIPDRPPPEPLRASVVIARDVRPPCWALWVNKPRKDRDVYVARAEQAAAQGRYRAVIRAATRALLRDPAFANAFTIRATAFTALGRLKDAETDKACAQRLATAPRPVPEQVRSTGELHAVESAGAAPYFDSEHGLPPTLGQLQVAPGGAGNAVGASPDAQGTAHEQRRSDAAAAAAQEAAVRRLDAAVKVRGGHIGKETAERVVVRMQALARAARARREVRAAKSRMYAPLQSKPSYTALPEVMPEVMPPEKAPEDAKAESAGLGLRLLRSAAESARSQFARSRSRSPVAAKVRAPEHPSTPPVVVERDAKGLNVVSPGPAPPYEATTPDSTPDDGSQQDAAPKRKMSGLTSIRTAVGSVATSAKRAFKSRSAAQLPSEQPSRERESYAQRARSTVESAVRALTPQRAEAASERDYVERARSSVKAAVRAISPRSGRPPKPPREQEVNAASDLEERGDDGDSENAGKRAHVQSSVKAARVKAAVRAVSPRLASMAQRATTLDASGFVRALTPRSMTPRSRSMTPRSRSRPEETPEQDTAKEVLSPRSNEHAEQVYEGRVVACVKGERAVN
jgi:hypothetical protein